MSFLQNASIRTKILSLILPICIVGLGATGFMSDRYKHADTAYSDFSPKTTQPWWSLPVRTATCRPWPMVRIRSWLMTPIALTSRS
ncbi:hypothetical protein AGR2A_Cc180022 [Agrobacterium genomosp. 2 str. CFBP 5494]|uniref:Uncharacterized protein n=1 Tax=Agrobacterium genomosp. 2 str. CFBP 5494 TaxID=1183436 RepID=A0A9W5B0S3_9HYPH|nr:hypothetical protein AGR2A_Cc180022 [Agrobacterium genomosp. 2 str. CFBP 5494]